MRQGSEGEASLKCCRFLALLCNDSLVEFQGLLATGLGASRGFKSQGTRVVGAPEVICSPQLSMTPWVILNNDQGEKVRAGRDHEVLVLLVVAAILVMFVYIIKHNSDYR